MIPTAVWVLIGVTIAAVVLYMIVNKESNSWYTNRASWMNYFFGSADTETAVPRPSKGGSESSTWCFVGEDNTGRWCVEVPVPSLCEPIRSYGTRGSCELTLTQQLPSGISKNGGTSNIPLASLSVHR